MASNTTMNKYVVWVLFVLSIFGVLYLKDVAAKILNANNQTETEAPALNLVTHLPPKHEADAWLDSFRAAKNKVFDGLFINNTEEHPAFNRHLFTLSEDASKLFKYSPTGSQLNDCSLVATNLMTAWHDSAEIVRTGNTELHPPNAIILSAWQGSEQYGNCLAAIKALN